MPLFRTTLTYVARNVPLVPANGLARLTTEDADYLESYVEDLRKTASRSGRLLSRFNNASVQVSVKELLAADDSAFVDISGELANWLHRAMKASTNPSPGVFAVIASGDARRADAISILKLDAENEAASYEFERGQVRLHVLRELLPKPGDLQKGIRWPDHRDGSDAVVADRNQVAARYFFEAFGLRVSATSSEAEKALAEVIIKSVSDRDRAAALRLVADMEGPAEDVVTEVQKHFPSVRVERRELGDGDVPGGYIRKSKVAQHQLVYRGDGIRLVVPHESLDRVKGPREVGGEWEIAIRFSARPEEDVS